MPSSRLGCPLSLETAHMENPGLASSSDECTARVGTIENYCEGVLNFRGLCICCGYSQLIRRFFTLSLIGS